MKDYNEMAESVFERRDKYNAKRRMAMNMDGWRPNPDSGSSALG